MKLAFVFIGGHKEVWLETLSSEYQKKLSRFAQVEILRLKPSRQERASAQQKQAEETEALLRAVKKDDVVIVCDEKGDEIGSVKLSAQLVKCFERGRPRVVILVGGAFGFSDDIRRRADWTWSLSKLTLNHHIAQAVVLEQTYRAFAIWKNIPYHNE